MSVEKIPLWENRNVASSITPYLLEDDGPHPAVLVIPGGGYGCVCEPTEGKPIARRFNELGYHAFVLEYRVWPELFPAPQQDAVRAMRIIRHRAAMWRVISDRVAVCGFSAGGHLAGSLGTLLPQIPDLSHDAIDAEQALPDAMILCYGDLDIADDSPSVSCEKLFDGRSFEEKKAYYTLRNQIGAFTPPAFVWHTVTDQLVDFHKSVRFAQAMAERGKFCELHLYPLGDHGMLQGIGTREMSKWPEMASAFLENVWEFRSNPDEFHEVRTHAFQVGMEREKYPDLF